MPIRFLWLAVIAALTFIELNTANLVCLWFIAGAIGGFITAIMTDSILIQLAVFAVVSGVTLALTKPMAEKLKNKPRPTNSDRVIGKTAEVTEVISPDKKGRVKVDGLSWMAESQFHIPAGRRVKVLAINGVTLEVVPSEDNN